MNDKSGFPQVTAEGYVDAYRSQLDSGLELMSALLAATQRMQELQFGALRDAQQKYAEVAGRFTDASSVQDVIAMQKDLVESYAAGAVGYWTKLTELLRDAQSEISGIVEKQGGRALEQATASVQAPASAYGAPGNLIAVMQTAFDAARDANAAFVQAFAHPAAPAAKKKPARHAHPGA